MSSELYMLQDCGVSLAEKEILTQLSLTICHGDFITVSGRSGSGKSTLLQLLCGFLPPSTGCLLYKGREISESVLHELRRSIAVVFQEPVLLGDTIVEAVYEPFEYKCNHGLRPDIAEVEMWFERFDIRVGLDAKIGSISGGEKQRVALIRALLLKREVLLVDEVTSALDAVHRRLVYDILRESGVTVIAVSHDSEWIEMSPINLELLAPAGNGA